MLALNLAVKADSKLNLNASILIPVFRGGELLIKFLNLLNSELPNIYSNIEINWNIVLVDDGSPVPISLSVSQWRNECEECCFNLIMLKHVVNLGQGAALETALRYTVNELNSDIFITMDADGQHRVNDIEALLKPLLSGENDIVFGNRFAGEISPHMPKSRKYLLQLAIMLERWIAGGLKLDDAHNGFRAFTANAAKAISLRQNRMAHATEFKQIVATAKLRYSQVPVSIDYFDESLALGQRNLGALMILKDLFKTYLFQS
jgi:polyprenyl-phospho-N-acetylgalactosaminyl synthase